MLFSITKKRSINQALKWAFSGLGIFFIGMLVFITVYDLMTGATSQTSAEYCAKYSVLASPDCW